MNAISDHAEGFNTLKWLLEEKLISANEATEEGSLLHTVIQKKNLTMLQLLLKHHANINAESRNEKLAPVCLAARYKFFDGVKTILDHTSIIDAKNRIHYGEVLLRAVYADRIDLVELLLKLKASTLSTLTDNHGHVSLHVAIKKRNLNILGLLLKYGADPSTKYNIPHSPNEESKEEAILPIELAAQCDFFDGVKILLEYIPEMILSTDIRKYQDILIRAVRANRADIVQHLLILMKVPANEYTDNDGNSCLHVAALKNNSPIFDMLLTPDADFNAKNRAGKTPLELAASCNNWYAVKRILSKIEKIDPENMQHDYNQILWNAVVDNENHIVQLLRKKGLPIQALENALLETVKVKTIIKNEKPASDKEEKTQAISMACLLLENGASVNTVDPETKDTPMHLALKNKNSSMVQLLLQHNPDLTRINDAFLTPLQVAARQPDLELFTLILKTTNINNTEMLIPFLFFIDSRNRDDRDAIMPLLLKQGVSINSFYDGDTLMHLAVREKDINKLEWILSQDPAPDLMIRSLQENMTPLELAIYIEFFEGVEKIFPRMAMLNNKHKKALHHEFHGRMELLQRRAIDQTAEYKYKEEKIAPPNIIAKVTTDIKKETMAALTVFAQDRRQPQSPSILARLRVPDDLLIHILRFLGKELPPTPNREDKKTTPLISYRIGHLAHIKQCIFSTNDAAARKIIMDRDTAAKKLALDFVTTFRANKSA